MHLREALSKQPTFSRAQTRKRLKRESKNAVFHYSDPKRHQEPR